MFSLPLPSIGGNGTKRIHLKFLKIRESQRQSHSESTAMIGVIREQCRCVYEEMQVDDNYIIRVVLRQRQSSATASHR